MSSLRDHIYHPRNHVRSELPQIGGKCTLDLHITLLLVYILLYAYTTLPFEMLQVHFQPTWELIWSAHNFYSEEAHYKYGTGAKEVHTSWSAIEVERKPTLSGALLVHLLTTWVFTLVEMTFISDLTASYQKTGLLTHPPSPTVRDLFTYWERVNLLVTKVHYGR